MSMSPERKRGPRPRPNQEIVSLQIEDLPVPLKRRIIARAEKDGTNMNDVAVGVLAAKFNVRYVPSAKTPPIQAGDGGAVAFKMPLRLHQKIKHAAVDGRCAARDVVISVLEEGVR